MILIHEDVKHFQTMWALIPWLVTLSCAVFVAVQIIAFRWVIRDN